MQRAAANVRAVMASLTTRPRASQHVKTLTNSQQLEEAWRGGVVTDSGVHVSPDTAMNVAAVWACVRIISQSIAMCPLVLFEREGDKEVEAVGHPVHYLLKHRPNRFQTPYEWKQLLALHLLMRGNSYWFVGRVGGRPDELFPMHPDQTQLYRWSELEWQYYYSPYNGGFQIFEPHEVMHTRGLSFDGVEGLGVVEHARQTIGLAAATEKHGARLFGAGAQVPAVLKMGPGQKLSDEARQRVRDEWAKKYAGLDNAYKVPVLEEGMEYEKMALTAEESQFIDSRKFSRSDIAMFFGVPPHMLGDVEKQTSWGSGIEQQSIGFVINTIQPWLTNIENAINAALLGVGERNGFFARFDTTPLIRGSFRDQVEALIRLREWGVLTPNEIRKALGYNPREDEFGDDYVTPSNMTSQVVGPPGGAGEQDRGKLLPYDEKLLESDL